MNNNLKYRLGFFKKNKFTVCKDDFIMSKNEIIGQYITSNWFKQEIVSGEKIYFFLIKYISSQNLETIYEKIPHLHCEEEVLNYANTTTEIISSYLLNGENIVWEAYTPQYPKRITMTNIQGNDINSSLSISSVKDCAEKIFVYGATFSISIL